MTTPTSRTSAETQRLRLTLAAKAAARHADLTHKRSEQLKTEYKAAKKAYKIARKVAKKATKKAARRADELAAWLKRSKSKPALKPQPKRRRPQKPTVIRSRKRTRRSPAKSSPLALPLIPTAAPDNAVSPPAAGHV